MWLADRAHLDYEKILCSWYCCWQQIVLLVARLLRQLLLAEHMFSWCCRWSRLLVLCIRTSVLLTTLDIKQCCGSGSGSAWIRIKLKVRILIRIRIKMISWIRIRICINFQMTSQNVWSMSLFEHFFKVLSLYLEATIRIRIRIRMNVKGRIRIRIRIKVTSRIK